MTSRQTIEQQCQNMLLFHPDLPEKLAFLLYCSVSRVSMAIHLLIILKARICQTLVNSRNRKGVDRVFGLICVVSLVLVEYRLWE